MKQLTRRRFLAGLGVTTMSMSFGKGDAATRGPMLTRPIGRAADAETLPVIGMGTWNTFDVGPAEQAPLAEVLGSFQASGGRVIDSSPMYGRAEAVTGELAEQLRLKAFLATKVWTSGREKGLAQIEQSMRLLKVRALDLLQIHNLLDWRTHIRTLQTLKADGRVRYIGVTHYAVQAYSDLEGALKAEPFDFAQFNYSLATRDAEQRLLPFCQERGIAVLINRPFEEGVLFTRVRGRQLPGYAADIGCTSWAQFFLKFIVSHPAVTCVIPATSRVAHMQDNMQAGFGALPDTRLRQRMVKDVVA